MGRNTNYAHNMLLNDSDSDDDFEIIALLALEEEWLERERASTSCRGSTPIGLEFNWVGFLWLHHGPCKIKVH